MVTKEILSQYIDLQGEIKEVRGRIKKTEEQLNRIMEDGSVIDKVKGGEGGIQSYKIEGFPSEEYSKKRTLLCIRKANLSALEMELMDTLNQVEEFISSVDDSHVRRIISLRFVEDLTWQQVAQRMGNNTEDSVRKTFDRFMLKN